MIREFLELIKLKQTLMLVFSSIFSYLICSELNIEPKILILLFLTTFLAVSSATIANMIIDVDIDKLMFRTRNRPLVKGRFSISSAKKISILLLLLSIILGFEINIFIPIFALVGYLINVFVYSLLLKRRTLFGIILGSIAGGLLPLGGSVAYYSEITFNGILLFSFVYIWSILHINFISLYYIEDYSRANIPSFPTKFGIRKSLLFSSLLLPLLLIVSVMFLKIIQAYLTIFTLSFIYIISSILMYKIYKVQEIYYARIFIKILNIIIIVFFVFPIFEILFKKFM